MNYPAASSGVLKKNGSSCESVGGKEGVNKHKRELPPSPSFRKRGQGGVQMITLDEAKSQKNKRNNFLA
jgi:hypothetical protein